MLSRRYLFYILLVATTISTISCQQLETVPVHNRTEDIIYDENDINGFFAEQAFTNLYTFLPKGFNRIEGAYLDAATDDALSSRLTSAIYLLSKGLQSETNTVDDVFEKSYTAIYRVNLFLSKIDVVPISEQTKRNWKAEARFIRAISYFELVKRYGGVPLLNDTVFRLEDQVRIPKNSYEECIQYIVNECTAISGLLLKEPVSAVQLGRITQGAALALKARTLLYAASPLNNPSHSPSKWQEAAEAAKAVLDLNYYALNANFKNTFITRSDKEIILAFQDARSNNLETAQAPIGYVSNVYTSNGSISPTQEFVDAFPTISGKAITDPAAGYDESNPYANRDPRLEATVFYNGSQWLGRAVETFEGGKDKPNGTLTQTKTGYYLRKFLSDLSTASDYVAADHNFIIFRYAEILLNYAEAINEVEDSPTNRALAIEQLIKLRKRANLLAGPDNLYGLAPTMSQQEVREAIRLERRIELAFEEHRFWDVRRWNTGSTDFNKTLHGMKITKNTQGGFSYQRVAVEPLVFIAPKMNLYPIPFKELQANTALKQNQGW